MADSGGTAPSMNRCTRLLRHPQAGTNLQVIQVHQASGPRSRLGCHGLEHYPWRQRWCDLVKLLSRFAHKILILARRKSLSAPGAHHGLHLSVHPDHKWKPSNLALRSGKCNNSFCTNGATRHGRSSFICICGILISRYAYFEHPCSFVFPTQVVLFA